MEVSKSDESWLNEVLNHTLAFFSKSLSVYRKLITEIAGRFPAITRKFIPSLMQDPTRVELFRELLLLKIHFYSASLIKLEANTPGYFRQFTELLLTVKAYCLLWKEIPEQALEQLAELYHRISEQFFSAQFVTILTKTGNVQRIIADPQDRKSACATLEYIKNRALPNIAGVDPEVSNVVAALLVTLNDPSLINSTTSRVGPENLSTAEAYTNKLIENVKERQNELAACKSTDDAKHLIAAVQEDIVNIKNHLFSLSQILHEHKLSPEDYLAYRKTYITGIQQLAEITLIQVQLCGKCHDKVNPKKINTPQLKVLLNALGRLYQLIYSTISLSSRAPRIDTTAWITDITKRLN